jgi:hypothetical protein
MGDKDTFNIQDTKDGHLINLKVPPGNNLDQFLEAELLAAGLTAAGERKQRSALTLGKLSYRWNCYFPNSGHHTIALVFRLVCSSDILELGVI